MKVSKDHNLLLPGLFILTFFLLLPLPEANGEDAFRYIDALFDPALDGGEPELILFPADDAPLPVPVWIRAYVLDDDDQPVTRASQLLTVSDTMRYTLPVESGREIVGISVQKEEESESPWFDFRALYLDGSPVIDYNAEEVNTRPDDFYRYWEDARERLSQTDPQPQIEEVPDFESETGRLYRVTLQSWDDVPVVGWFVVPEDAGENGKTYPAIQIMPGWGAEQPPMDRTAEGFVTFSLNPRSHGPSREYFETPVAHHLWNIDQPEEYYYRAAYMAGVRGLDFLSDRREVDAERIAVEGGSQGGAFAIALAGLDNRVAAAVANVPYISNIPDYIRLSTSGSGGEFLEKVRNPENGETAARSLAYIDAANIAYDINVPTQIIVGEQDVVTPPLNGVVARNRIPEHVPAELLREFSAGHEITNFMRESNLRWYREHLK